MQRQALGAGIRFTGTRTRLQTAKTKQLPQDILGLGIMGRIMGRMEITLHQLIDPRTQLIWPREAEQLGKLTRW